MIRLVPLALRNLLRNPGRNLVVGSTIAFGAFVLLLSLYLGDGITRGIVQNLVAIESGAVMVTLDKDALEAFEAAESLDGVDATIEARLAMLDRVAGRLEATDGLEQVRRRLVFDGLFFAPAGDSLRLQIEGVDPAREAPLRDYLVPASGRFPEADAVDEVFLSQMAADELGVAVDDVLTLVGNAWDDEINAVDLYVAGIFEDVAPWIDYTAFVPLEAAQDFFGIEGLTNQFLVDLDALERSDGAVRALRADLADEPVTVRGYVAAGGFLFAIANANRYTFYAFDALLLVVVALGIANLMAVTVRERQSELGTFSAIGFNARHLMGLLLVEVLALSLLAAAVAIGLGLALYAVLASHGIALSGVARNAFGTAVLYPDLRAIHLVVVLAVAVGTALVGALVPVWRASRRDTSALLRKA